MKKSVSTNCPRNSLKDCKIDDINSAIISLTLLAESQRLLNSKEISREAIFAELDKKFA